MSTTDKTAAELIARKQAGGDCTEDESAWIKRYFDANHPVETEQGQALADAYPLEKDDWFDEVARGFRPTSSPIERSDDADVAERYLIEAQNAGMIGDDDWQASTDRRYFMVNFGDGRGVVEYTSHEIVAKLAPEGGFFNRGESADYVSLTIEYVMVGNDKTDALGWDMGALAAICYDEGEHQGIHYMVPVTNSPENQAAGRELLLSMIDGSGFPYRVQNDRPKRNAGD